MQCHVLQLLSPGYQRLVALGLRTEAPPPYPNSAMSSLVLPATHRSPLPFAKTRCALIPLVARSSLTKTVSLALSHRAYLISSLVHKPQFSVMRAWSMLQVGTVWCRFSSSCLVRLPCVADLPDPRTQCTHQLRDRMCVRFCSETSCRLGSLDCGKSLALCPRTMTPSLPSSSSAPPDLPRRLQRSAPHPRVTEPALAITTSATYSGTAFTDNSGALHRSWVSIGLWRCRKRCPCHCRSSVEVPPSDPRRICHFLG